MAGNRFDADVVLGELLTEARLQAGLSGEEASLRARLTTARLAGIEEGSGRLHLTELIPLMRIYGTSLGRFCGWLEREVVRRGMREDGDGTDE